MMTRAEEYAEGFAEGWRWAEADMRDGLGAWWEPELRDDVQTATLDIMRAYWLGALRGYRAAFAARDAGRLTRSMHEVTR